MFCCYMIIIRLCYNVLEEEGRSLTLRMDFPIIIISVSQLSFHSRSAASHPGLFCLPMSHKRDARLK